MKTALIQCPNWTIFTPPYNLALLKAICRNRGHEVSCLDFNIKFYRYLNEKGKKDLYSKPTDWFSDSFVQTVVSSHSSFVDSCVEEILALDVKAAGFNITGLNRFFAEEVIRRLKSKDKDKIIFIGGPHCFKAEIGKVLLYVNPGIDAICYLEGENVVPNILDMVEKEGRIGHCPGISFRSKDNEVIDCPDEPLVEDLNSLPFADFSDFKVDEYFMKELPISTSRGCINRCIFCSESNIWKRYRSRSARSIFDEITYQLGKYPYIRSFFFNDSLLNGNLRALEELCDLLIDNHIDITWGGQAAIRRHMGKDLIEKMKKAGCFHLTYGLESVSPKILKMIGKDFSPELAERVIRDTHQAGIKTDVTIIIGFPTETEEDVALTGEFLRRNREFIDEIFFHLLVIARGTYLYENRESLGIELEDNFNSVRWHSNKEINTLAKRLEILDIYNKFVGQGGTDFYSAPDYYIFSADKCFRSNDYKNALALYLKAKALNKNTLKARYIEEMISASQKHSDVQLKR
jgi:radical SAM superfamily enzyme YgiQ (UPF0313 family)